MPQLKTLTGESALTFLLIHDPDHAQHLGFHIPLSSKQNLSLFAGATATNATHDPVVNVDGYLTVTTTSQPGGTLAQDITVTVPSLSIAFTHTGTFSYPPNIPYPVQDCTNVAGTLYLVGENPAVGSNLFNAQQYPAYPPLNGSQPASGGRVTIDLWNDDRITGVFKTNVDNYVSGGSGTWAAINA
ncbi:hypothetical protein PAXINDRAFT_104117 [Paxillus involutus ATCC 200175]|uniref:Uncharacterized protein n=1 Tax=Paxillus involutus ATCC 200175 TaxID=664439 RepID=A0A0C9SLK3_PAXIN|nr:hypothetical protein PAXINDRAFT_104117 [Paxillus involutus ATCC 200175]